MMSGFHDSEKNIAHHAERCLGTLRIASVACACSLAPISATANGYLTCILPANKVAIAEDVNSEISRKCFSRHLKNVFGAEAQYFPMSGASAKSNLETANTNAALMAPQSLNAEGFDLAVVVTAFGTPQKMALDSGSDFKELAMISAENHGSKVTVSHEIGDPAYLKPLKTYNFAALAMAQGQSSQHFHVVGIYCD